jgi:mycofactocin glycosyltransferase
MGATFRWWTAVLVSLRGLHDGPVGCSRRNVTERFWESIALRLDAGTRRHDSGRTLLGGSPLRLLRLSERGARVVDELVSGGPVGDDPDRQRVARHLLDGGLAHPQPTGAPVVPVAVAVPVRDHATDLGELLDRLTGERAVREIVVVDDGSRDPATVTAAVGGRGQLIRHDRPFGPAAARNRAWRASTADVVVFVDADVLPERGWLGTMCAHFVDPEVAAVAPRIRARRASSSALDRYEEHRSPLDLGAVAARVAPGSRVSYVPTATIAYRRTVLTALGGFDEALTVGEDVDLVWRAVAAGHTVRYEPGAVVRHRNRPSWRELARQRFRYGSSAAALDARHPGSVAPVEINAWSLAAWALPVLGGRRGALAGLAAAAVSTAALVPGLRDRVEDPVGVALRIGGLGNLWAGRWLAHATVRAWLPLALTASTVSRRGRRATLASLAGPAAGEWLEVRPDLDPIRWTAATALDDASYCAGAWWGCWRQRSLRSLVPRVSGAPWLRRDGRANIASGARRGWRRESGPLLPSGLPRV